MNIGKLVQKLLGMGVIGLGILVAWISGDSTGTLPCLMIGLWLIFTKEQLLGEES